LSIVSLFHPFISVFNNIIEVCTPVSALPKGQCRLTLDFGAPDLNPAAEQESG